jgi:hypothetical protein
MVATRAHADSSVSVAEKNTHPAPLGRGPLATIRSITGAKPLVDISCAETDSTFFPGQRPRARRSDLNQGMASRSESGANLCVDDNWTKAGQTTRRGFRTAAAQAQDPAMPAFGFSE